MIQGSAMLVQDLAPAKCVAADSHSNQVCEVETCLPPLDEVTVGSSVTDDSSSVSSMSSNEDFEEKPRSIFKAYWDKSGMWRTLQEEPTSCKPKISRTIARQDSKEESSSVNTYERTLKHQEKLPEQMDISPRSRRRIFGQGCWSQSTPSLSLDSEFAYNFPIRKTCSASLFTKQPKASCLRQSKYSGNSLGKESIASVSFRKDVDVLIFQKPVENYAADGWSNWFA